MYTVFSVHTHVFNFETHVGLCPRLLTFSLAKFVGSPTPRGDEGQLGQPLELGLARSLWFFCENETSRETNLARRDFSRDRVSHGLARIVSARPPKTSFKTYFRHNNALIIVLGSIVS